MSVADSVLFANSDGLNFTVRKKYSEMYTMFYLCLQQRILSSFMADNDGLFEENRHYRMLGHRRSVVSDFAWRGTNGHIKSKFFCPLETNYFFVFIFHTFFQRNIFNVMIYLYTIINIFE